MLPRSLVTVTSDNHFVNDHESLEISTICHRCLGFIDNHTRIADWSVLNKTSTANGYHGNRTFSVLKSFATVKCYHINL